MFVCRSWNLEGNHRQELKKEFRMSNRLYVIRKGIVVGEKWNLSEEDGVTVCEVEKV